MQKTSAKQSTTLIINTYQQAHFLPSSIESALKQTIPFDEIMVVDDGSTDDPDAVVANYPGTRLIRQSNAGLAAARNSGLKAATSDYITFLDADDLLTPGALESGLRCIEEHPGVGMVYGAYQNINSASEPLGDTVYTDISADAFRMLLLGNFIAMHGTVLYERKKLVELGGFDASLPRCEDYDLYLRMVTQYPIASHPNVAALYRWHGHNMSKNYSTMLKWALHINSRQKVRTAGNPEYESARLWGRNVWCGHYTRELLSDVSDRWTQHSQPPNFQLAKIAFVLIPRVSFEVARWAMLAAWSRLLRKNKK